MIYWDTSCVLKLYTAEPDSAAHLALLRGQTEPLLSSEILRAELCCAFWQKELRGDLQPGAAATLHDRFLRDDAAGRLVLIPVGRDVIGRAAQVAATCSRYRPALALRTIDTLHLGTALLAGARHLVTTDRRMRTAAAVLGLPLLDA